MANNKRFYYKSKDGSALLNFKSPIQFHDLSKEEIANYEQITEEEFNALVEARKPKKKPTEENGEDNNNNEE